MFLRSLITTGLSLCLFAPTSTLANVNDGNRESCETALHLENAKPRIRPNSSAKFPKLLEKAVGDLESVRQVSYQIEVVGKLSTKALRLNFESLVEQLVQNSEALEKVVPKDLSPDQQVRHQLRLALATETANLISLAARRYHGSDADLVLARDAYARQVETAVRMTSATSTAMLPELNEHLDFVRAIVQAKNQNPALTEAEATAKGVEAAYKKSFFEKCKDGSCKVPSDAVLTAGAKVRLKELKDCI